MTTGLSATLVMVVTHPSPGRAYLFQGSLIAVVVALLYRRVEEDRMLYLPNYASALRCIGQSLQNQKIEVFELKTRDNDFWLQCGDPNPPYLGLIDLKFSIDDIKILDREGRARRHQSNVDIRFDSLPEILRAIGEYIDSRRGHLRRIGSISMSNLDDPTVESEYETRAGDIKSEILAVSAIREIAVHMYKKRTRLANPIGFLTRQR